MTEWIITSSVLILIVAALRTVLKGKIGLRLQYALWGLVLVRLLAPISLFDSGFSVMNAVEHAAPTLAQNTGDVVLGYRDYLTPDLSVAEPDPNAPLEEQKQQYEENLADWKVEMEAAKAETGTPVTVADAARALWLGVGTLLALWFLAVNLRFGHKLRAGRSMVLVKDCPLPVYRSSAVETPCLFGLFSPAVYLTEEVTEEAMGHVLAHELTHYRHGDHVWSALRCLCLALHWYNPLVWLAAALSRRDGELACDEGALKRIGEEQRAAYGRTLIGLTCRRRSTLSLTATTMTGSKGSIAERIWLIAKKPQRKKWVLAVLLVLVAAAAGCTFSSADKTGAPDPDEAGRTWSITLIQTDESSEMMFSDVELQTPSGELCIQNRNLFPVYVELYHGNVVVMEETIRPGGQCIFMQAYADVTYRLEARAEVEPGTEIRLMVYDGNAEQEPYTLDTQETRWLDNGWEGVGVRTDMVWDAADPLADMPNTAAAYEMYGGGKTLGVQDDTLFCGGISVSKAGDGLLIDGFKYSAAYPGGQEIFIAMLKDLLDKESAAALVSWFETLNELEKEYETALLTQEAELEAARTAFFNYRDALMEADAPVVFGNVSVECVENEGTSAVSIGFHIRNVESASTESVRLDPVFSAVYELFEGTEGVTLTLYLAEEGKYNGYAMTDWYAGRFDVLISGYRWVEVENPETTPSEYWLTAESSDGTHKMTFWSGESSVAYHDGGMIQYEDGSTTTYWIGAPLNAGLVSIARDIREEYNNLDVSFSRIMFYQEGDAEKAAKSFVHSAYGSHRISSLAPGNWYRFTEYEVIDWAVREVSEDGTAVVGWFNYAFVPENMESPGIWAGNTANGTGEYEGMLTEYREFVLQKQEDGYWHCVGLGTGGYSLDRY